MSDLAGLPICVLDLETAKSADDCRHCGVSKDVHPHTCGEIIGPKYFEAVGWHNKAALGLSIGCYYDYRDSRMHWFDVYTLEETVRSFVDMQPLLVSFNGIAFDFVLMRGLLRRQATDLQSPGGNDTDGSIELSRLCDYFKTQCAASYDILAAIWKADPARKVERGINSLDAIGRANWYGSKEMDGATAPRLWAQGRHAEVLTYCQGDVLKTKALFEQIVETGSILRGDGAPIVLLRPMLAMMHGQRILPGGVCGTPAYYAHLGADVPSRYFCTAHAPKGALALFPFEQFPSKVCEFRR